MPVQHIEVEVFVNQLTQQMYQRDVHGILPLTLADKENVQMELLHLMMIVINSYQVVKLQVQHVLAHHLDVMYLLEILNFV